MTPHDILGLIGVSLAIYCYARVQWHRDYAKELSFSVLNLVSALFVIISLLRSWNIASFVANICYATISVYGIYRCLKYKWLERRACLDTTLP